MKGIFKSLMFKEKHKKSVESKDEMKAKMRDVFVNNIAYRLNTDILSRITRSSIALREVSSKTTIPRLVSDIIRTGEEYANVLESLQEYHALENGSFFLTEGPFFVRNVVTDAIHCAKLSQRLIVSDPSIVDFTFEDSVPVSELIGDSSNIQKIVEELMKNGLRHSIDNKISVHVSSTTTGSNGICLVFKVSNKGDPLTDEQIKNSFIPFSEQNRSETVNGCGVGIGLCVCKKISAIMNGSLEMEYVSDSTILTLKTPLTYLKPLVCKHLSMIHKDSDERNQRLDSSNIEVERDIFPDIPISEYDTQPCILVVDDSEIVRENYVRMLKFVGAGVESCSNGHDALEMLAVKKYDVISLDVVMPGMSGVTCAYLIRSGNSCNKETPIVINTADVSQETRKICNTIKDSVIIHKPTRRNILLRTVSNMLTDQSQLEWMRRKWNEQNI